MTLLPHAQPGLFKAYCRRPRWVTQPELAPLGVDPDSTQSRWDKSLTQSVFLVQCDFKTDAAAELEVHMAESHPDDPNLWNPPHLTAAAADRYVRAYTPRTAAVEPSWKPPRLLEEGRPFQPKDLEVGTEVAWSGRTGQVWSLGHAPRSVWVVPDEPSRQYRDGLGSRVELAVLLVPSKSGGLHEHQTSWSSWRAAA